MGPWCRLHGHKCWLIKFCLPKVSSEPSADSKLLIWSNHETIHHHSNVTMNAMASQITGASNIKTPRHWPLCGEFASDRASKRTLFPFEGVIMPRRWVCWQIRFYDAMRFTLPDPMLVRGPVLKETIEWKALDGSILWMQHKIIQFFHNSMQEFLLWFMSNISQFTKKPL